jgi:hypothetical protein
VPLAVLVGSRPPLVISAGGTVTVSPAQYGNIVVTTTAAVTINLPSILLRNGVPVSIIARTATIPAITVVAFSGQTVLGQPSTTIIEAYNGLTLTPDSVSLDWYSANLYATIVNVKDYGAKGDATANDTTAIQNAINTGAGIVRIPQGTYLVTGLSLITGVNLIGDGINQTVLQPFGTIVNALVNVAKNASNFSIQNMTFDGTAASSPDPPYLLDLGDDTAGSNGLVYRVKFTRTIQRAAIGCFWTTGFDWLIVDKCEFFNCPAGGIALEPQGGISRNLWFTNNLWDTVGTSHFILHWASVGATTFNNVYVINNMMQNSIVDLVNYPDGPIPMEHWGVTGYVCSGNIITSGTRGLSLTNSLINAEVCNNVVSNQTLYGAEWGGGVDSVGPNNVTVHDNVFINCANGIACTSTAATIQNFTIKNNVFRGTGLVSHSVGAKGIGSTAVNTFVDLRVTGNIFVDMEFIDDIMDLRGTLGGGSSIEISGNTYFATTFNSCINFITSWSDNSNINNNWTQRTSNYDNTHYSGGTGQFIFAPVLSSMTSGKRWNCEYNRLEMYGSNTATILLGIGSNVSPVAAFGIQINRNSILGNFTAANFINAVSTAGDTTVKDNDVAQTNITLNAAVIYRRITRRFSATAAPTTGTWTIGDVVDNEAPAAGQPAFWMCTVTGTPGTWRAGPNL